MSLKFRLVACFAGALVLATSLLGQGSNAQEGQLRRPGHRVRRGELEERAGWRRRGVGKGVRNRGENQLCGQLNPGQADGTGCAGANLHLRRRGLDELCAGKGLIKPESRSDLLGNKLVLIAPKDSPVSLELKSGADLTAALGTGRLAMGNVDSVQAGKYGKAALEKLGAWAGVSGKLAQAESVRAALLLVSRGEAVLGVVYRTDAISDANVRIVATFPADSHPPIVYPAALTAKAGRPRRASWITSSPRRQPPSSRSRALRC